MLKNVKNHSRRACARTAGPVQRSGRHRWIRCIFPIVGLVSLLWFLVRVIPKPSRATYPCQRVAFPLASSFVIWLLGVAASITAFRRAKWHFARAQLTAGIGCLCVSVLALWLFVPGGDRPVIGDVPTPNAPLGTARGAQPGRVVWVHEPDATDWAGYDSGEHWYDDAHTDPIVVSRMVSKAIRRLAGENTDAAAWDALFRSFNAERGWGSIGYTPGERIAIKINNTLSSDANSETFEQTSSMKNRIDNSPQMIVALLGQLVHVVGVAEEDITIGDPGRIMPNLIYDRVHPEFPNVCYLANVGGHGRTLAQFSSVPLYWSTAAATGTTQDYLPQSFAWADYLINFAILKSHNSGGITVCGKNHYGSLIRDPIGTLWGETFPYYNMHTSLAKTTPGTGQYRCMVDLLGHRHLGGKTLLHLVDALFAGQDWRSQPVTWVMAPFNGDWPSSLFVSQDGVAVDSVCFDFLWTEWDGFPRISGADDYLVEAALANSPPSGTVYDPEGDGIPMTSLGVHEHWNNAADKQYSRNLGTGTGIELVAVTEVDDGLYGPVYRFWSETKKRHFYTMSEQERDKLIDHYSHVWTYEGAAYDSCPNWTDPDLVGVYRFWSDALGAHFYTASRTERQKLIDNYSHRWTYEGVAFYTYASDSAPPGTLPVHRFWSDTLNCHFYTISDAEADKLIAQYAHVWAYEGVAWHAYEIP